MCGQSSGVQANGIYIRTIRRDENSDRIKDSWVRPLSGPCQDQKKGGKGKYFSVSKHRLGRSYWEEIENGIREASIYPFIHLFTYEQKLSTVVCRIIFPQRDPYPNLPNMCIDYLTWQSGFFRPD